MKVSFSKNAQRDFDYWKKTNVNKYQRIKILLESIIQDTRVGKPEPLKYQYSGFWSRRIDKSHRLVYRVFGNKIEVISCRYHY